MSKQDYIEVEENLFADTGEEENRDYYEEEANDYTLPDPEEASKNYNSAEYENYENIDDEDEEVYESFSPLEFIIKKKYDGPILNNDTIKDIAETNDMFNTRIILNEKIQKIPGISIEKAEVYSRVITNRLWYNLSYNQEVENYVDEILKFL